MGLEYTIVVVTCGYSGVSGGDLVLVGEAAEDLLSADPVIFEVDLRWLGPGLSGWELVEGSVRVLLLGCKTGIKFILAKRAGRGDGQSSPIAAEGVADVAGRSLAAL